MKHYHALFVLFCLLTPSFYASWNSYHETREELLADMNQAIEHTLNLQKSVEITPDTIQNYLAYLTVPQLREYSYLYYAMDDRREPLCSRRFQWSNGTEGCEFQSYASCSMFSIFLLSDQRWSAFWLTLSVLWCIGAWLYMGREPKKEEKRIGSMVLVDGTFVNGHRQPIHLTPMQEQLMKMFFAADGHCLSKQEICDALWPKKPDASDTLYTTIKRLKPIVEEQGGLQIESERGKDYILTAKP